MLNTLRPLLMLFLIIQAAEIAEPTQQLDKKEDEELAKLMDKVGI